MNIYIKEPRQPAQACVIWMHGLGADAQNMADLANQLPITVSLRQICLQAPIRPVTLNNHMLMSAWYDIIGLSLMDREDHVGLKQSAQIIQKVIDEQIKEGFSEEQIFLAGFSQGGAMALFTGLQMTRPLGGIVALSAYLPLASKCEIQLDPITPLFLAAGVHDPLVLPAWSRQCVDIARDNGFQDVSWHEYSMEHNICAAEVGDLAHWFNRQVGLITHRLGGAQ